MTKYAMRRIIAPSQNPNGEQLLASVVLTAPAATMSSGTFPARRNLRVTLFVPSRTGNTAVYAQFNGDTAANYSAKYSVNLAAFTNVINQTSIVMEEASTQDTFSNLLWIVNNIGDPKRVKLLGDRLGNKGSAPSFRMGAALWENYAAQVTEITIGAAANALGTGSQMRVYGAD